MTEHSPPGKLLFYPFPRIFERSLTSIVSLYSLTNVFVIGSGPKAWISLPKGKGTKLTIAEERDVRRKQRAAEQ